MDSTGEKALNMVVELFRHNTWANLKLLEACDGLSDEQLDATGAGTYGSIRATLVHIVKSEVSYVHRVNGRVRDQLPTPGHFAGFDILKADAIWCGEELEQLALSAGPDDIVHQIRQGRPLYQYPLASLMIQAINHSTEHRTHVATILTQQGIEPPDMSGWGYMSDKGVIVKMSDDE